ncbi:hypothetical protein PILCRDRAFT_829356 [Piloderma croceum F 1598]|uniref:Uncharacterized protein n=1 Tax=Piloderma croceum (strain F 1598) TaxID=765440 RepID=A0A0C3EZ10_PILCF|nr:hypothetical protein PILCRDRAFT_829356 [Piloderma croceum F 1598]
MKLTLIQVERTLNLSTWGTVPSSAIDLASIIRHGGKVWGPTTQSKRVRAGRCSSYRSRVSSTITRRHWQYYL